MDAAQRYARGVWKRGTTGREKESRAGAVVSVLGNFTKLRIARKSKEDNEKSGERDEGIVGTHPPSQHGNTMKEFPTARAGRRGKELIYE